MANIEWQKEYELGFREIDNQHKKLIGFIDNLINSINKRSTKTELTKILENLTDYAKYHFQTEEKYFKKFHYKETKRHIKEHQKFTKKIAELSKKHKNREIEISFELIDFLEDWLIDHLMNEDQKYVQCFKENGLK